MKLGALREAFSLQIKEVDEALAAYLERTDDPAVHYGMVRYHLGFVDESLAPLQGERLTRGKRLRAIFSMLIGKAIGASPNAVRTLMLASEMMHNASLVHDDIQDADPLRWGRPTVWSRWGTGQAINVGDALIGMTYQLLLRLRDDGVEPEMVMRVLDTFNRAHLRMAEGQHLDLVHQGRLDIGVDRYLDVISRKTAAACECIAHCSALLAARDAHMEECYRKFGHAFGMLYQVCDDINAIWGSAEETGKQSLRDVVLRKSSLPLLYAVERGSEQLRSLLLKPAQAMHSFTGTEALMIRHELTSLRIDELCRRHAVEWRNEALGQLRETGISSFEHSLLETMTNLCAEAAGIAAGEPAARPR